MYKYLVILQDCVCISSSYAVLYFILIFNKSFASFEYSKRMYIVKNFIKSAALCYMAISSFNDLIPQFYNVCDNELIRRHASIYVSNDIVALLVVRRLPLTTKIHHTITTILLFYSFNVDFNDETHFGKLLIIYTMMSSYTSIVNFYLAARFFRTKEDSTRKYSCIKNTYIDNIRKIAYYNYKYICALNWTLHINILMFKLFNNKIYFSYYFYFFFLYFIISDDLILMSWLRNKVYSI